MPLLLHASYDGSLYLVSVPRMVPRGGDRYRTWALIFRYIHTVHKRQQARSNKKKRKLTDTHDVSEQARLATSFAPCIDAAPNLDL